MTAIEWPAGRWYTYPLAAPAYGPRMQLARSALLTHTYDHEADRALCSVKPENVLADGGLTGLDEPPTCPTCRRRDPRFKPAALRS